MSWQTYMWFQSAHNRFLCVQLLTVVWLFRIWLVLQPKPGAATASYKVCRPRPRPRPRHVLSWRLQFEKNRMRTYVVLIVSYFFKYRIISCVCLVPNMRHIAHLGRRLLKVRSFWCFVTWHSHGHTLLTKSSWRHWLQLMVNQTNGESVMWAGIRQEPPGNPQVASRCPWTRNTRTSRPA